MKPKTGNYKTSTDYALMMRLLEGGALFGFVPASYRGEPRLDPAVIRHLPNANVPAGEYRFDILTAAHSFLATILPEDFIKLCRKCGVMFVLPTEAKGSDA